MSGGAGRPLALNTEWSMDITRLRDNVKITRYLTRTQSA